MKIQQPVIRTVYTDGGRKVAGLTEHRDCTVRALAIALKVPYLHAHATLSKLGRRQGHGFLFRLPKLKKLGACFELRPDLSCLTLRTALPEMGNGRFIVRVRGHVFAVINGVIFDTVVNKPGCRIKMVYQVVDNNP